MSAALIDLVSVGAQDVYITGDPQVSFFRQNYKRHTNFSIKPERMDYIGTFESGNEISIPIKSKGDLLSYVWIENANILLSLSHTREYTEEYFITTRSLLSKSHARHSRAFPDLLRAGSDRCFP